MTTILAAERLVPASRRSARARHTAPTAILTSCLTAQLMAILDVNIVNVAAATIRTDLHAGGAGLQLIIAGYLIAYAVAADHRARVGGMLGHRRMFLVGSRRCSRPRRSPAGSRRTRGR